MIRAAHAVDAGAIAGIYNHYIRETVVSFEEEPLGSDAMANRMQAYAGSHPWMVHEEAGEVLGYAYARPFHERAAYRHSAESSIYLHPDATGRGIGRSLYTALLEDLKRRRLHVVLGGIALPNPASVALHEGLGFEKCAHLPEVGWKFGRFVDVGWWALRLDDRRPGEATA